MSFRSHYLKYEDDKCIDKKSIHLSVAQIFIFGNKI